MLRQSAPNASMTSKFSSTSSSSSLPLCGSSYHHDPLYSNESSIPIVRRWLCLLTLFLLLPWGLYSRTISHMKALTEDIKKFQELKRKTTYEIDVKRDLTKALESEKQRAQTANNSLISILRKKGVLVDTHAENYEKLEKREGNMISSIDDLENHIRENCRFAIERKFGKGSLQVELVVRSKSHMRVKTQTLLLELAQKNLFMMPHASHHFLRMVSERLWEGMSFMPQRSEHNRLLASPIDMETLESRDWRFENAKLKNLVFDEHAAAYKCGAYSVGFSGSPGGPDFFVNSILNSEESTEDSCFAKVVEGKEIIDDIILKQESPVLGIETLRLLPPKEASSE